MGSNSPVDLLAYWRWDDFLSDLDEGAGFNFNSNQPRLHSAIDVGESLWLVTGRPSPHGTAYVLAARLVITAKTHNAAGYRYEVRPLGGHPGWRESTRDCSIEQKQPQPQGKRAQRSFTSKKADAVRSAQSDKTIVRVRASST